MTYGQYAAEIQRLQDALARVAKEAVPQWISVKDRMPDKDGNYLVVTDGIGYFRGYPEMAILYFYKGQFKLGDKYVLSADVTHWMSLPPLPITNRKEIEA